jgi:hypothetical protein
MRTDFTQRNIDIIVILGKSTKAVFDFFLLEKPHPWTVLSGALGFLGARVGGIPASEQLGHTYPDIRH